MNKKDFPAAHSMDSSWYAVDEKGHVARFETGEAGCMPHSVEADEGGGEGLVDLLAGADPAQVEFYADDLCQVADGQIFQFNWRSLEPKKIKLSELGNVYSAVIWLRDESLFNESEFGALPEILFGKSPSSYSRFVRLPNHKFILAFATGVETSGVKAFIKEGKANRLFAGLEVTPARLGFYEYEHGGSFENWIAGPFVKETEPKNPIRIEALPEAIRKMVGSLRFQGVDFSVDHAVDAYEHDQCHSWGSRFVTLTGEVREEIDRE